MTDTAYPTPPENDGELEPNPSANPGITVRSCGWYGGHE